MKETAPAAAPSHWTRTWRAVAVLAFVILIGPAIGGVLFPGPFYAPQIWWGFASGGSAGWSGLLSLLGYLALFGYVAGLLPAIAAGVVMAIAVLRRGSFGYLLAVAAGVAGAGAMAVATMLDLWQRGTSQPEIVPGILVIYTPICVAAAIVCRFLLARIGLLAR